MSVINNLRAPLSANNSEEDAIDQKQNRLYQLNSEAKNYYQYQLRGKFGAAGREYLHLLGLTPDTIRRFGLGYAGQLQQTL